MVWNLSYANCLVLKLWLMRFFNQYSDRKFNFHPDARRRFLLAWAIKGQTFGEQADYNEKFLPALDLGTCTRNKCCYKQNWVIRNIPCLYLPQYDSYILITYWFPCQTTFCVGIMMRSPATSCFIYQNPLYIIRVIQELLVINPGL